MINADGKQVRSQNQDRIARRNVTTSSPRRP